MASVGLLRWTTSTSERIVRNHSRDSIITSHNTIKSVVRLHSESLVGDLELNQRAPLGSSLFYGAFWQDRLFRYECHFQKPLSLQVG